MDQLKEETGMQQGEISTQYHPVHNIDWSVLYRKRKEISAKFGNIWHLPIRKRYHTVLLPLGGKGIRLLEIGAGDRKLKNLLTKNWGEMSYRSCDVDQNYHHDFRSNSLIVGEYDIICAFELIEHLGLKEARELIEKSFQLLVPGGKIVLTTPNIYYPPGFLRDVTHITPWCYDELGGMLSLTGFNVTHIYRLYNDSLLKKFVERIVFYSLFRLLGIDFAKQIIVVAEKP
ncbi:MAG: class I SAM-dependent methyltransferase [Proteobacteria bacterium]|nr:class I SAM-dependent methyltransferase [Pseudomonadota bacterium]